MKSFKISVVIPTYNRISSLLIALKRLDIQFFCDVFEVIVVDDGSSDSTLVELSNFAPVNFNIKVIVQKNSKQGAARNNGVRNSSGDLIIFLQDDIWVSREFLKEHYDFHINNSDENIVAIGKTEWIDELKNDGFHKFLDGSGGSIFKGPLFDYGSLQNGKETDFFHFYTNNLSIKKNFFEKEKFNEKFSSYGWEDVEIGFRLSKIGMKLYFLQNAIAQHNHKYLFEDFINRERSVATNRRLLLELQPELIKFFKMAYIKYLLFGFFSVKPLLYIYKKINMNMYYYFYGKKIFSEYNKV